MLLSRAAPKRVLPGFTLSLGSSLLYTCLILLLPFYVALFLVLMLVTYVPAISLWLPSLVL